MGFARPSSPGVYQACFRFQVWGYRRIKRPSTCLQRTFRRCRNPGQSCPTVLSSMRRKSGMFDLSLEVLRVVEDAAIASARTMGMGDPHTADQAAVESMRRCLDTIAIDGTIVIGEGERDKAPMLYIGEKLGAAKEQAGALTVDIAVHPPEGTNLSSPRAG